ncbi:esterase/lipase, putative [unidentified eubacterium SCB49]|nr:esterase/lipase, putative [unidentified eubacterium SCB49]
MSSKKTVSYTTTNSYHTQGKLNDATETVWIVFHGLGYLSTYFIRYFSELPDNHFVICPQAPSKYYQGTQFKHVGASWLTRVDTKEETKNVLNYVDAVYKKEITKTPKKLIVLGYSQGVSIATRWVASKKISCHHLILHSGGIPVELTQNDFKFLKKDTKVTYIYGDQDEYINEAKKTEEQLKGTKLFEDRLQVFVFKGVHEVNKDYINSFA